MKKIAVILSGCGFRDGSEITEAVSSLIAISQHGAAYSCFAPNINYEPTDHLTGKPTSPPRNVLHESARIARGHVSDIKELRESDFDAILFPGGYGAAQHLCSWASQGANCAVLSEVENLINDFHKHGKPIGAMCIAPVIVAKVLGKKGITVTIGNDLETATEIKKTGAHHENCPVDDFVTDREHKVITTPAYMYNAKPHLVFKGISGLAKELVEMA